MSSAATSILIAEVLARVALELVDRVQSPNLPPLSAEELAELEAVKRRLDETHRKVMAYRPLSWAEGDPGQI
ncbi:MAG: hypothetical protein ACE5JJ_10050 [Nitrospinota bacterium]